MKLTSAGELRQKELRYVCVTRSLDLSGRAWYFSSVMSGRIGVALMLVAALLLSAGRLPAASCILCSAPAERACPMGCCQDQDCCDATQQRTGPAAQPPARSSSEQQNIAALASMVAVPLPNRPATEQFVFFSAKCSAHSPPPLALICIRLI
jgi:hypothetical protein